VNNLASQQIHNHQGITDTEFTQFQSLIYDKAGISLSEVKKTLVVSRLTRRLRHFNFASFSQYYQYVTDLNNSAEMQIMVDLLTTNETYFFREEKHFEFLSREILSKHKANRTLRVWSAACSRGQEPYSLAMVLADKLGIDADWKITATDISSQVLNYARRGLYPLDEAKQIPSPLLNKWCLKGVRSQQGSFLIDQKIRQHIEFKNLNLIGSWPDNGIYSVIFLRNVMIYFDTETKRKLVDRLLNRLQPGGYLIVGHSESLNQITDRVKTIRPSIYQLKND